MLLNLLVICVVVVGVVIVVAITFSIFVANLTNR